MRAVVVTVSDRVSRGEAEDRSGPAAVAKLGEYGIDGVPIEVVEDGIALKDYAAQRLKEYPSIGDQLDAAYKARHGDDSDQIRIDEQISMVKQNYPKSDECL